MSNLQNCPTCKHPLPTAGAASCTHCGSALPVGWYEEAPGTTAAVAAFTPSNATVVAGATEAPTPSVPERSAPAAVKREEPMPAVAEQAPAVRVTAVQPPETRHLGSSPSRPSPPTAAAAMPCVATLGPSEDASDLPPGPAIEPAPVSSSHQASQPSAPSRAAGVPHVAKCEAPTIEQPTLATTLIRPEGTAATAETRATAPTASQPPPPPPGQTRPARKGLSSTRKAILGVTIIVIGWFLVNAIAAAFGFGTGGVDAGTPRW